MNTWIALSILGNSCFALGVFVGYKMWGVKLAKLRRDIARLQRRMDADIEVMRLKQQRAEYRDAARRHP